MGMVARRFFKAPRAVSQDPPLHLRLAARLQHLVPRYWATRLVWRLARVRRPDVKDWLIRRFVRLFDVDTSDAALPVPAGFETFNDFFTRELAAGARPVDPDPAVLVSPADGTVSQAGRLVDDTMLQAKGCSYRVDDLLLTDLETAAHFAGGAYATIYLAPYNYHRVHAPFTGELRAIHYIPGELFSVNAATAAVIPGLFHRNERLVMHFEAGFGPAAVILVGAVNVGSISTPWTGEIRPRRKGVVDVLPIAVDAARVGKGDLLGWFNMGSTVIVLTPPGACDWLSELGPGAIVRMGQAIGRTPGEPG